ncbi:MAG: biopolymer transporter ExbD [Candidatus Schekmanbacteria bacterium]|nr:MAG: biopolymer transporter ExbD [Candidatus Schekmanbacteria bacterium]
MGMEVGGRGIRNEINVVPLIDIVLVLLVIFMVIIPLSQKGLDIKLPEKTPPKKQEEKKKEESKNLVVSVRADSSIDINSEPVAKADLEDKVREELAGRDNKMIFIKAAGSLVYGSIVDIIDICKGAGAETIAIITEGRKKK